MARGRRGVDWPGLAGVSSLALASLYQARRFNYMLKHLLQTEYKRGNDYSWQPVRGAGRHSGAAGRVAHL